MAERTTATRVVYVDDDPNEQLLFQEAVEIANLPFEIQGLTSFGSAVAYLSGSGAFSDRTHFPAPGLIVLDYNLEDKTGADLVRWVRTQPELSTVPVVMYTGEPSAERISDCYACGANHFFAKPLELPRVLAILQELYELVSSQPASTETLRRVPEYCPRP